MTELETDKLEILWVGSVSEQHDLALLSCNVRYANFSEALGVFSERPIAVVVVSIIEPLSEVIDLLGKVSSLWPNVSRVLFAPGSNEGVGERGLVHECINKVGIHFYIRKDDSATKVKAIFEDAVISFRTRKEQNRIHQEVKLQNAKLEAMTDGLELMVAERTKYLSLSKSQVEGKISGMRGLIQFIKSLSSLGENEDLMLLLRVDIKSFHQVINMYLGYLSNDNKPQLMYFRGQEVLIRPVKKIWNQSLRIRVNQVEDSQYLANEFSRPFAKVIGIPILIRSNGGRDEGERGCDAILYFEHTFLAEDGEVFLNYIGERLQPLGITFDRIQLDRQVNFASIMWERTFDGIKDPIAILDRDYSLMRSNQSFAAEGSFDICYAQFTGQDEICVGCPIKEVFESSEPQVGKVRRGNRMFEVHSYPIQLVVGSKPTTVVNYYVDVTLKQELQGKMIQNEKMAAIGHLAGNIAHELNNPLTGIRSLSQVLLEEVEKDSNQYGDLVEVEKASARCQSIITNLLEFSKEEGATNLSRVSLNDIIQRTLPFLKVSMRNYSCCLELSDQEPFVLVEPQLLQQVVFNIVNNACQAMPNSGVLTIQTDIQQTESGKVCHLSVSDTGAGISQENIKSIFDPFFTTKSVGQGTGLGLSMSKSIVDRLGGNIAVKSIEGEGTTFYIDLPYAEVPKELV